MQSGLCFVNTLSPIRIHRPKDERGDVGKRRVAHLLFQTPQTPNSWGATTPRLQHRPNSQESNQPTHLTREREETRPTQSARASERNACCQDDIWESDLQCAPSSLAATRLLDFGLWLRERES